MYLTKKRKGKDDIQVRYIRNKEEQQRILKARHSDATSGHLGLKKTTSRITKILVVWHDKGYRGDGKDHVALILDSTTVICKGKLEFHNGESQQNPRKKKRKLLKTDKNVQEKSKNKSTSSGISTDAATSSTTTEKKQLERILKEQPCHVVKARIGRFTIHHGSFHTLKPGTYINDEVVNGYLRLLANIHENCCVIGTFSMTAIINRAAVNISAHLMSKEVFTDKRILAGVYNQGSNHWILIEIDLEAKVFYYMNPSGPSPSARGTFGALKKYFKTRNDLLGTDKINIDKFRLVQLENRIQGDNCSCGIYCLKMAEQLMLSGEINERQLRFMDVNRARENIGITLLSCVSSVCTIIPSAADLQERCTMCGAGDTIV